MANKRLTSQRKSSPVAFEGSQFRRHRRSTTIRHRFRKSRSFRFLCEAHKCSRHDFHRGREMGAPGTWAAPNDAAYGDWWRPWPDRNQCAAWKGRPGWPCWPLKKGREASPKPRDSRLQRPGSRSSRRKERISNLANNHVAADFSVRPLVPPPNLRRGNQAMPRNASKPT